MNLDLSKFQMLSSVMKFSGRKEAAKIVDDLIDIVRYLESMVIIDCSNCKHCENGWVIKTKEPCRNCLYKSVLSDDGHEDNFKAIYEDVINELCR